MPLDILDNISKEQTLYIGIRPDLVRLKEFTTSFQLDTVTWDRHIAFLQTLNLVWQEFKYSDVADEIINLNNILPHQTGVYKFVVKPSLLINGLPKFVLYIGIAGANASGRTLRSRVKDYFQLSKIKKRDAIERLIYKYYPNLYISYTPLNLTVNELLEVESNLIGFFGTHIKANKDDAPIELKPQQKAFNV